MGTRVGKGCDFVVIGATMIVGIDSFISLGEIIKQGLVFFISCPTAGAKFIKYTSYWAITTPM